MKTINDLPIGTRVKEPDTRYYGKPIVFSVAAKGYPGYPNESVTLVTDRIIALKSFDALEPGNSDSRNSYGNAYYKVSNIRNWLNSNKDTWYTPAHTLDAPPEEGKVTHNPYNSERGFLNNFTQQFAKSLMDTTFVTAIPSTLSPETLTDKIYLLSRYEVGLDGRNSSALDLFKTTLTTDNSKRLAYPDGETLINSSYSNANLVVDKPWTWWLRDPHGSLYEIKPVERDGRSINASTAFSGFGGVRPALNIHKDTKVSESPDSEGVYTLIFNSVPTLDFLTPPNTNTLYESDTLPITGSASDTDNGDILNVRYQINALAPRAIKAEVSDGVTAVPFSKTLTFKGGILYDGPTAITSALAEGVAHTLKVWAEDDKGGKSVVEERTFYVVPNRPPALAIDAITPASDLINADTIDISGVASDPDGNAVTVAYKLNNGLSTQVLSGPGAPFSFDVNIKDLKVGANTLIVEVTDSYGFKASKTITLNKTENLTPLLKSTQRYEITPPSGSAKGVLLWIQRAKDLTVSASASMTLSGEQETYLPMTKSNTAPVTDLIDEDEYIIESVNSKEKIILKLELSRASAAVSPAISLISGVLS